VNIKITVFSSLTCLLHLYGEVGKNCELSTVDLFLIFTFLHQVLEFCTHVDLFLCFLYHILFCPTSCLGCLSDKETLLKATGSHWLVYSPNHCFSTSYVKYYFFTLLTLLLQWCVQQIPPYHWTQTQFPHSGNIDKKDQYHLNPNQRINPENMWC
jgi:hypothetical protein